MVSPPSSGAQHTWTGTQTRAPLVVEGRWKPFRRATQDGGDRREWKDRIAAKWCQQCSDDDVSRGKSYFVESVGKGFVCARGGTEHFPVIHNKFVSTRGLLSLGHGLERASKLD